MGLTEYLGARRNENAQDRLRNRLSGLAGPREFLKRADRNEAILNALQEPFFAAQQRASQSGADTLRRVLGDDIEHFGGAPELAAALGLDEVGNKDPRPEVISKKERNNAVLMPKRKGKEWDPETRSWKSALWTDIGRQATNPTNPYYKYPFQDFKGLPGGIFDDEHRVDRQDEGWRARKPPDTWRHDSEMSPEGVGFDPYANPGRRVTSRSMTNLGDYRLTPDAVPGPGAIAAAQRSANSDSWRSFYQQAIAGGLEEAGESQDAQLAAMGSQPWVQKPIGMQVWGPFVRDVLMKAAQYGMGQIGGGTGAPGGGGATGGTGAFGNYGMDALQGNNMDWMKIMQSSPDRAQYEYNPDYSFYTPRG